MRRRRRGGEEEEEEEKLGGNIRNRGKRRRRRRAPHFNICIRPTALPRPMEHLFILDLCRSSQFQGRMITEFLPGKGGRGG